MRHDRFCGKRVIYGWSSISIFKKRAVLIFIPVFSLLIYPCIWIFALQYNNCGIYFKRWRTWNAIVLHSKIKNNVNHIRKKCAHILFSFPRPFKMATKLFHLKWIHFTPLSHKNTCRKTKTHPHRHSIEGEGEKTQTYKNHLYLAIKINVTLEWK